MPLAIKHIVLADDDPDDIQLFQEAIINTCPNINLRITPNGVQLLKAIVEDPRPDVILLDLNMPCKSGKECLEEIRANEEFQDVPVLILSTSNQQKEIDDCLKRGANHYFVKPQSFDGMKEIVKTICSGSFSSRNQPLCNV